MFFSPGGAAVVSQGREPLDQKANDGRPSGAKAFVLARET